jgi:AcrR family transcriptional regulator
MPTTEPANARSRRTRAALLAAARELLEREGFEALTMAAVAERAGVTRRSVYLHFASRSDLVAGLFDHVAAAEGLQESLGRVWAAPDARAALEAWAAHVAGYGARVLAVDRAVARVQRRDPDAAAHRRRVQEAKLTSCRHLAEQVAAEGRLAAPWTADTAADVILALSTSDVIEALGGDRGWSRSRTADGLARILTATLLADD